MAAKLQCEICGGKLIGKPDGIFECDSCGMEYDTAWAKAKIQEISGTVKVEGTVEVQGSVKVEGPVKVEGAANKESLLKRGNLALEDGKWKEAEKHFNEALNADAECAEAYLGIAMAQSHLRSEKEITELNNYEKTKELRNHDGYLKFLRFADANRQGQIKALLDDADAQVAAVEAKDLAERAAAVEPLRLARERIAPAQKLLIGRLGYRLWGLQSDGAVLASNDDYRSTRTNVVAIEGDDPVFALCADGTVEMRSALNYHKKKYADVENWTSITSITTNRHIVGLHRDGTVIADGNNDYGQCEVAAWTDVISISAGPCHTVGLRRDGTVLATSVIDNERSVSCGQSDVSDWKEIAAVFAEYYHTIGLRADGTVVIAGKHPRHNWCVDGWTNIVDILTCDNLLLGLRSDGTVLITGVSEFNYSEKTICIAVSQWRNIVALCRGDRAVYGLVADGTVVCSDDNKEVGAWRDVVAIYNIDHGRIMGIRTDGTILVSKFYPSQKRPDEEDPLKDVVHWKLFNSIDTIEEERKEAAAQENAKRKARREALNTEKTSLQTELSNLKGLFNGKRRKEIETRLAEIDAELEKLG